MSSIATNATPGSVDTVDRVSKSTLFTLPEELLWQILSDAADNGNRSGIILVSETGDERELLTEQSASNSLVCKRFQEAIHKTRTPKRSWETLPKTHVYNGDFRFFFDLNWQEIQSRITRIVEEHIRQQGSSRSPCIDGWARDRYEAFLESPKNDVHTLIVLSANSSEADIDGEDEDSHVSARYSDKVSMGLNEVSYWAYLANERGDKRLLRNLRRIKVVPKEKWRSTVGRTEDAGVYSRSVLASRSDSTSTNAISNAAFLLRDSLNSKRPRAERVKVRTSRGRVVF